MRGIHAFGGGVLPAGLSTGSDAARLKKLESATQECCLGEMKNMIDAQELRSLQQRIWGLGRVVSSEEE